MQIANLFDTSQITLKKYIYGGLIALRLLIGLHVFYLYASSFGGAEGKGGTFFEATTTPITFLPYASAKDDDKLFQHMLFQGCTEPVFSGSNILYENKLCDITTDDYQTFSVSVPANYTWSDEEPITIEDVYFTYVTLLTENVRNLPYLEKYQNITSQVNGSELNFTFPSSSIDNMIFFTNFLLPQHVLANQEYEWYTSNFANELTSSTCVLLDTTTSDENSAIFDLSQCSDFQLKYFQVKYFDGTKDIIDYSTDNSSAIDLVHSDINIEGYDRVKYISNKFSTLFFNTIQGGLNQEQRKYLARLFIDANASNTDIAPDQFLFDSLTPREETDLEINPFLEPEPEPTPEPVIEDSFTILESIKLNAETPTYEFRVYDPINASVPLNMVFDEPYTTIFVNHNSGLNYTPESYSTESKSAGYNLNPTFKNIVPGKNNYEIRGIRADGNTDTYSIDISYLEEKIEVVAEVIEETEKEAITKKYTFIYFGDELNTSTVKVLKKRLEDSGYGDLFEFIGYDNTDELDGKISAGDFDVVIRTLDMGLRRDLSNIFSSQDRYINPSGYINDEISTLIQDYFIGSQDAKDRIKARLDEIYSANVPHVILGKKLESYLINKKYETSPFPERLYVMGWRKEYLKDISIATNTSIERSQVFDRSNLVNFIKEL